MKEVYITLSAVKEVENFGNPMWSVSKQYFMVVVEKEGDKVAIKTFDGFLHRRGGVQWFKKSKNMSFISVNVKTGDVYVGNMVNYHLKPQERLLSGVVKKNKTYIRLSENLPG
jgi:hypothetical protein